MKSPEVSIIVPVYKVEDYLERCVKSILAQTYTDFELILVDDWSPDRCGEMCDVFAKEDPRIRVIHKKNGGLSDARNVGMDVAIGKYLIFIDSDDFIPENALERLCTLVQQYSADIAIGGICNCYETWRESKPAIAETHVYSNIEMLKVALTDSISACGKLISADLCRNYRFEVGRTYEDAFFTPKLLLSINKAVMTNEFVYFYWHRSGSITTKCDPDKVMDVVDAYQAALHLVENNCSQLIEYAKFRLYWSYFTALDRLMFQVDNYQCLPQYDKCVRFLKTHWIDVLRCSQFAFTRRISIVALRINVKLYYLLSSLNQRKYGINN